MHLQSEMCNIQQLYRESAQDYYERLVHLQVAIQDRYPERLHEMELERTAQEAFYNGLRDEYKPMVVHMLENPGVTVGDLVKAVRKDGIHPRMMSHSAAGCFLLCAVDKLSQARVRKGQR